MLRLAYDGVPARQELSKEAHTDKSGNRLPDVDDQIDIGHHDELLRVEGPHICSRLAAIDQLIYGANKLAVNNSFSIHCHRQDITYMQNHIYLYIHP